MEVHAFLKEDGVFLHYTGEDLDHDLETVRQIAPQVRAERCGDQPGERRAG